jgi:hypothetical protein
VGVGGWPAMQSVEGKKCADQGGVEVAIRARFTVLDGGWGISSLIVSRWGCAFLWLWPLGETMWRKDWCVSGFVAGSGRCEAGLNSGVGCLLFGRRRDVCPSTGHDCSGFYYRGLKKRRRKEAMSLFNGFPCLFRSICNLNLVEAPAD